jgi:hypothetical protein
MIHSITSKCFEEFLSNLTARITLYFYACTSRKRRRRYQKIVDVDYHGNVCTQIYTLSDFFYTY